MSMLFSSCKKDDDKNVPVLTTSEISQITKTVAFSGGMVIDDGGLIVSARGVCWSTDQKPTIKDSKTEDGVGAGSFISRISDLEPNTEYFVRAYATNKSGTAYGSTMSFNTLGEVKDVDGNIYTTITIGDQEWFVENLQTTKYNDGTPIPNVTEKSDWIDLTSDAYVWYDNLPDASKDVYGALYNWYAVETDKLCPSGWHVPSDQEWFQLISYVDPFANPNRKELSGIAGGKLKSTRTVPYAEPRWVKPNEGASDEYGFSALPGGSRNSFNGDFDSIESLGVWWSSTKYNNYSVICVQMLTYKEGIEHISINKNFAFSVRCVKDK